MLLSLNEIVSKSTRALQALELPAGLDTENGKNIGWLEIRNLPGLKYLHEELRRTDRVKNKSELKINVEGGAVNFLSPNQSGFLIAQSAVDFAENGKIVSILECRYPLLLFAEMSRRSQIAFGFRIEWTDGGQKNIGISTARKTAIDINSKGLELASNIKLFAMETQSIATFQEIVDHQTKLIKGGIGCDPCQWETICIAANEMLVPDSKKSHSSAGAEVDDSL